MFRTVEFPYDDVRPYSIWVVADSSVFQEMRAVVLVVWADTDDMCGATVSVFDEPPPPEDEPPPLPPESTTVQAEVDRVASDPYDVPTELVPYDRK